MILRTITAPILAGLFAGILSCPQQQPINVNVELSKPPLVVDNHKSQLRLRKLRAVSNSPHYNGKFPIVGGITDSRIKLAYDLIFSTSTNTTLKQSCIWIKDINIKITYAPTMYISRDYSPDSCKYQEIYDHEIKHINVDIDTVNSMAPYMQDVAIETAKQWMEPEIIKTHKLDAMKNKISKSINDNLNKAMNVMRLHLEEKQRRVDSEHEYNRISEACPTEIGFQ